MATCPSDCCGYGECLPSKAPDALSGEGECKCYQWFVAPDCCQYFADVLGPFYDFYFIYSLIITSLFFVYGAWMFFILFRGRTLLSKQSVRTFFSLLFVMVGLLGRIIFYCMSIAQIQRVVQPDSIVWIKNMFLVLLFVSYGLILLLWAHLLFSLKSVTIFSEKRLWTFYVTFTSVAFFLQILMTILRVYVPAIRDTVVMLHDLILMVEGLIYTAAFFYCSRKLQQCVKEVVDSMVGSDLVAKRYVKFFRVNKHIRVLVWFLIFTIALLVGATPFSPNKQPWSWFGVQIVYRHCEFVIIWVLMRVVWIALVEQVYHGWKEDSTTHQSDSSTGATTVADSVRSAAIAGGEYEGTSV